MRWALLLLVFSVRLPATGATLLAEFPVKGGDVAVCCGTAESTNMYIVMQTPNGGYTLGGDPKIASVYDFSSGVMFDAIASRLTNGVNDQWLFGTGFFGAITAGPGGEIISELAMFCGRWCTLPPAGFGPDLAGDKVTLIRLVVHDYRLWTDTTTNPPCCPLVHGTADVTWQFYGNGGPYPQLPGPPPNPLPEPATAAFTMTGLATGVVWAAKRATKRKVAGAP